MPCWDWAVTGDHHGNPTPSTEALAHEHEGSIEVVVLAKLTGPNDCRLRWGGTASQVMCNLILSQSKSTEASALKKQNKESMYLPVLHSSHVQSKQNASILREYLTH